VSKVGQRRALDRTAQMTTDLGLRGWASTATMKTRAQSAPELPADRLVGAADNARYGVVTHITIKGERVANGGCCTTARRFVSAPVLKLRVPGTPFPASTTCAGMVLTRRGSCG
jgi:hypothetical protein